MTETPTSAIRLVMVLAGKNSCMTTWPRTPKIAQRLHLAPSTVTRFIDTLAYRGYLQRRSEGKISRVFATESGTALSAAITAAWRSLHARYSAVLGQAAGDELTARIDTASVKLSQPP